MAVDGRPPNNGYFAKIDDELYPDLIHEGGLTPAVVNVAVERELDVGDVQGESGPGQFVATKIATDARSVSILLGVQERIFSIVVSADRRIFATGGTDDLLSAVEVASSWLGGFTLSELVDRFPFMSYSALSLAHEEGNPVEVQWRLLLEDDDFIEMRPALQAVYAIRSLRYLFPVISHNTKLRLYDDIDMQSARQFWITKQTNGMYRVEVRPEVRRAEVVESLAVAIEMLILFVDRQ